ncbi:hypothetical protein QMA09_15935 [Planococcus sp. APC 3906]|uniref:hypothetical protein n=1 Tax=Planococcus sp. APC 3906 TaxID=3035194 RepID=UPI0025B3AD0D|nr:hypothetical protein [Planococcus sp. APC 3906]MDN3451689.1 hypothetical protein [Planococcus sp. APC 3906]
MAKDKWDIPYPDEQEIERQAALIVQKAFPEKSWFFTEIQEFKNQMGWVHLFPNRSEIIFTSLLLVLSIFGLWFTASANQTTSPSLYGYAFLVSPLSLVLLIAYAFYEKLEKQTLELEMTTKFTIFQVMAVRMLVFSSISLFLNMTGSFIAAMNFEVDFLRIWFISLTGLFGFSSGLLWFIARGNVLRRSVIFTAGWLAINSAWLFAMKEAYLQVVFHLPLLVYGGILLMLACLFFYTFKKAFTRKQEGLWTC